MSARLGVFRPHRRFRSVGKKVSGKYDNFLAVVNLMLLGNDDAVGDDVVQERHAHRASENQDNLPARAPADGQDCRAFISGIPVEINCDVDFHLAQYRGDLGIALGLHIDEPVERCFDPPTRIASIVRPNEMAVVSKRVFSCPSKPPRDRIHRERVKKIR